MARQRTGHVEWRNGEWKTQCRVGEAKARQWVSLEKDLPPSQRLLRSQKDEAQALAVVLQERIDAGGYVPGERDLTVNEFFKRWSDTRRTKYPRQVKADEAAFRLWISAQLGTLPIRAVTRERLIEFSHYLDGIAAEGLEFGEKRARNIFSTLSAIFRDAHSSKDRTLRLLDENPMQDVPWPERGRGEALKQLLYPAEFLALVSCPKVPLVRARLYAVTLYTMTRAAEVRVLECAQIDVAFGNVKILKSDDPIGSKATKMPTTKRTKSGKARLVTLEPTLAPVLHAMIVERDGKGRIFRERPENTPQGNQWRPAVEDYIPGPDGAYGMCGRFKRDLRVALAWAGIKERPELFDDSDRRVSQSIRFHDLRASGITWRHARRDNPAVIRQECGHEDQATNEIYIRALRSLSPCELFPALPERLLGDCPAIAPALHQRCIESAIFSKEMVGAEGLEPPTSTV